jgi:hypothetical protein
MKSLEKERKQKNSSRRINKAVARLQEASFMIVRNTLDKDVMGKGLPEKFMQQAPEYRKFYNYRSVSKR